MCKKKKKQCLELTVDQVTLKESSIEYTTTEIIQNEAEIETSLK